MLAAKKAPREIRPLPRERRHGPRTPVSIPALLHVLDKASMWNVVELSHSGMLLERKRGVSRQTLPGLVRAVLDLRGRPVTVLARPVWWNSRRVALSTLAVTGEGESRLVDYLFELMYSEQVPERSGVHPLPR